MTLPNDAVPLFQYLADSLTISNGDVSNDLYHCRHPSWKMVVIVRKHFSISENPVWQYLSIRGTLSTFRLATNGLWHCNGNRWFGFLNTCKKLQFRPFGHLFLNAKPTVNVLRKIFNYLIIGITN